MPPLPGYYWIEHNAGTSVAGTGLSDDAYVGIGYSTVALLAILVLALVLPVIPFALACRTVKGSMPLGGSNSLVISAACHVPVLEEMPAAGSEATTAEQEQQSESAVENENENDQTTRNEPNPQQTPGSETVEMQRLLKLDGPGSSNNCSNEDEECSSETTPDIEKYLLDASQKPLRWGAVETPPLWNQQYTDQGDVVGHLSFGMREHRVQEPVDNQWYA